MLHPLRSSILRWVAIDRALRPIVALLLCLVAALLAWPAQAQVPALFTPLSADAARGVAGAQPELTRKIQSRATASAVSWARLNASALDAAALAVPLPDGSTLTLTRNRTEALAPDTASWSGTLPGGRGEATFILHDGNLTGSLRLGADLYRIEPVGDGVHALFKADPARLPPEHPPSFAPKERAAPPLPASGLNDAMQADGPVGVDVLVAYTTAAGNAVGDILATIRLAVAEANQAYVNSGINIRLNLVDTVAVAYSESGRSYDTILGDLVANADVRRHRDQSGADMVAMIINQTDYCGLADAILANEATAYAVVHWECATGYYSFAHELGHLQGARHDPGTDPTNTPYAYGHGYQYVAGNTRWRTVMAYDCAGGCPRLQYFSNPNVSHNGVAMGTAARNDNARVLNATATTVAAFRPSASDAVACYVFNDGYTNVAGPFDALYFRGNSSVCGPDGSSTGACRKWFGRCRAAAAGQAADFSVFNDGYANRTPVSDAVYLQKVQSACVPNGTSSGNCRKWFGRPVTSGGQPVKCMLFNDGYTSVVGPTDAIYARAPGQVCMPDGTATGTCRKWFGRCSVQ